MRVGFGAALALMMVSSIAEARGHTSVPIIIPVNTTPVPIYTGEPATIALTMAPRPAGVETGALTPGTVIAPRTLQADDAIVLTQGVDDQGIVIPAGSVLVKTTLNLLNFGPKPNETSKEYVVWCSTRVMPVMHAATQDCLRDSKDSGKLDEFWNGYVADKSAPMSLIGLSHVRRVPETTYRSAKPDERPTLEVGYRLCGEGDGVNIPFRFTTVMKTAAGAWTTPFGACPFGEWLKVEDKTVETVDAITLKLAAGSPPTYTVVSAPQGGPMGAVQLNGALIARGDLTLEKKRKIEAFLSTPLVQTGAVGQIPSGLVAHGAVLAEATVVHGVTGVLRNDIEAPGPWFTKEHLSGGQYVFGVPMHRGFGLAGSEAITWCAPRMKDNDPAQISTICFPPVGNGNTWALAGPVLMVTSLSFPQIGRDVVGLSVDRKPMAYPAPMTLTYVFDRWTHVGTGQNQMMAASVGIEIRVKGVATPIDHLLILPAKDKVYRLPVMGAVLTLAPVGNDGKPLQLASNTMDTHALDALFDSLDKMHVQVATPTPIKTKGPIILGGLISVEPPPSDAAPATPAPAASKPTAPGAP